MNEQPSSNKLSNQKSSVDGGLVGTGVHQFDAIRPFEPEELPMVYDRLLADPQFQQILKFIFPDVPLAALKQKLYGCKTLLDFQLAFVKSILE